MTKLSDTQSILLSTAAQREDGSLYPLADTLRAGTRVTKAIAALIDRELATERECTGKNAVHRVDGDLSFGVFVTPAGLAAIGLGDDGTSTPDAGATALPSPAAAAPAAPRVTKASVIVTLLERSGGATLDEMIAATGWLPHTTRAALTGLRKKGHTIERGKRGDITSYAIATAQ